MDRVVDPMIVRRVLAGPYGATAGYDAGRARDGLAEGRLDEASFGRTSIVNPDLPRRLSDGLPMNPMNPARLYGGGADGDTDDPFHV